jgi:hypothetical protein
MGPVGCPETSARNYHNTVRDIPEEIRYEKEIDENVQ